jgi:mycothiol synthase
VDFVELSASSPPDLLSAWHRLNVEGSLELLPGLDPPSELESWSELDGNADMARRGLLALDDGRAIAAFVWAEPLLEDTDTAWGWLFVDPAERRRTVARTTVDMAAAELVPRARTRVLSNVLIGGPGERFVSVLGGRRVQTAVCNVLDLGALDPQVNAARANAVPDGYVLRRWLDTSPEDLVEPFARAREAMNDAPHGEEPQDDAAWTADRVRLLEEHRARRKSRVYYTAAVAVGTGDMAGYTEIEVTDRPITAIQEDTGVVRAHRGHGLGLVVKAANLKWLLSAEPHVRKITTWNAESNSHMLAVNHQLGFRPHSRWQEVALDLQ